MTNKKNRQQQEQQQKQMQKQIPFGNDKQNKGGAPPIQGDNAVLRAV